VSACERGRERETEKREAASRMWCAKVSSARAREGERQKVRKREKESTWKNVRVRDSYSMSS